MQAWLGPWLGQCRCFLVRRLNVQVWSGRLGCHLCGVPQRCSLFPGRRRVGKECHQELGSALHILMPRGPAHTYRTRPPSGQGRGLCPQAPPSTPPAPCIAGLTRGSNAAGLAPPRCRGCGRSRLRCRPPHQAQRAGSADTPGPRSRRCCTPTPRAWARGSCSVSGLRMRTAEGAKGQGKVDGGTIASSTLLSRPSWILNTR